ncbi:MAG: hypothetical protein JEZ03_15745 [Bacteroidales bacterium]|nr:hypothetical protein [Bacteroidales bacterium]
MKHINQYLIHNAIICTMITFLFFSCTTNQENRIKNSPSFKSVIDYYQLSLVDKQWNIEREMVSDSVPLFRNDNLYNGGYYTFRKEVGDTLHHIDCEYYESIGDTIFIPDVYYKRYEDDYFQYVFLLGENSRILFHYKTSLFANQKKFFYHGKYYYQYRFNELNEGQRDFFEHNRDSLTNIKGHNLPKLPEI